MESICLHVHWQYSMDCYDAQKVVSWGVSNGVARGYHVALLCGDGDVRVVRMFTTQEYMQRLASDQSAMLSELRKLTGDENVRLGMLWDV